jgi:hypothetical protein
MRGASVLSLLPVTAVGLAAPVGPAACGTVPSALEPASGADTLDAPGLNEPPPGTRRLGSRRTVVSEAMLRD